MRGSERADNYEAMREKADLDRKARREGSALQQFEDNKILDQGFDADFAIKHAKENPTDDEWE